MPKTKTQSREIVFIDPTVSDIDTLIAGLRPGLAAIGLDASAPAMAQIAHAVAGQRGLDAIHIISHGAPGEMCFAGGKLSLDTIDEHRASLATIGQALGDGGDLLLWSCETAQGDRGAAFTDAVVRVTGIDVAAATGLVGAASRGGGWELDGGTCGFPALAPLTAAGKAAYQGLMDTGSATVTNLNILDTSKTNDTGGAEIITLAEVGNALFPTTNATQTLTVDAAFWTNHIQLTFQGSGGAYFTIWATSQNNFWISLSDKYGSVLGTASSFSAISASAFVTQVLTYSSLISTSALVTVDVEGGTNKDVIQGITNNTSITNIIQGNAGADVLTGGTGLNIYVYTSASDSPIAGQPNPGSQLAQTWDQITNFHGGVDKIDLRAIAKAAHLPELTWLGLLPVNTTTAAHYGVWYTSDGSGGSYVYADTDGNGTADLKIQVSGVPTLTRADFLLDPPVIAISPIAGDDIINKAEATAGVTISGTEIGADDQTVTVTILDSGGNVKDTYTTTAGIGTWWVSVTAAQAQALVDGSYTVTAVVDTLDSSASASRSFKVDETPPAETISSTIGTNTGLTSTISSGGLTKDNTLALSGAVSDAGGVASVLVYDGATLLGVATISGGNWGFTTGALTDGLHSFTAKAIDNVGNNFTTAAINATVDTVAPTAGTLSFTGLTDTGSSQSPAITQDGTFDLSLSGQEAGTDVTYQKSLNGGAFSATTASQSGLADGSYQFRAVVTDAAGNFSTTSAISVVIDTANPAVGTLAFSNLTDTGRTSDAIPVTTDNAFDLSLSGQEAGTDVTYQKSLNGGAFSTTTASQNGLADGSYQFRAVVTDAAGNASTTSAISVVIDHVNPAAPVFGAIGDGGAIGGADRIVSSQTNDSTVTGTAEANSTVTLKSGATTLNASAIVVDGSGNWTYTLTGGNITTITQGAGKTITATATDGAGNTSGSTTSFSFSVDTVAPVISTASYSTSNHKLTGSTENNATAKAYLDVNDNHVLDIGDTLEGSDTSSNGNYSITFASFSGSHQKFVTATDAAGNVSAPTVLAATIFPAGIAGSPINLALADPSTNPGDAITVTITGVQADWSLNGGTNNGDGSWTVQTNDPSGLYITMAAGFAGAMMLNVTESWTNAHGSTGSVSIADNVEAYPASPIFAVSGDDTLTGSGGNDEFVFAQPIGNDRVYDFDASHDTLDLIGFGIAGFADLQGTIANDAGGNAVVTLGGGGTITLIGVDAGALSAANFVFDAEPVSANAGMMAVSDGAILPIGGTIANTGTIAVASTGDETDLEILVRGATLTGGGHLTLSDNGANVVFGGGPSAVLDNLDNIISGAGQLGAGALTLHNEGVIEADGVNALVIDTGANTIVNAGALIASGTGGLVVNSAVTGDGNAEIVGTSSLEFAAASDAQVSFDAGASGTLTLDQSGGFIGTVAGFTGYDAIDLADIVGDQATVGYTANADGTGGMLTLSDGTHSASLALLGQYAAADFATAPDAGGDTLVTLADPTQNHLVIAPGA